jgi:cell division protein FtsN
MARMTTRDYKRPSRSSSVSKLKEFGLGVLVGALLASAAFLIAGAHARHRAAAEAARAHAHTGAGKSGAAPHAPARGQGTSAGSAATAGSVSASSVQPGSAQAVAQPPQYDFYRMLPRLNVPVPRGAQHPPHAPAPAASPPPRAPSAGDSYLVQVGAYRSSAEADQVRARLARQGIAATVDRFVEGSHTWHRVRIGPLSDAQLARVRAQLRTANVHALVIRLGH